MKRPEDMTMPELAALCDTMPHAFTVLCKELGYICPPFALAMWNGRHTVFHVSDCDRRELVSVLRRLADRLEQDWDVTRN